jgi:hypothetical protein
MSEKKRKIFEEWSCPVCLSTIEDGCVPSVMNGCTPFAHVACETCLSDMQKRNAALCPECRAPFTTIRPLAAFVDHDDPEIASVLKKRATVETLDARIAAVSALCTPLQVQRLTFAAKRMEGLLANYPKMHTSSMIAKTYRVPDFDKANVAVNVADGKKLGLTSSADLNAHMRRITGEIVPMMNLLFPTHRFAAFTRLPMRTFYLELQSVPR